MKATEVTTDKLATDLKRVVTDSEELLDATKETVRGKARAARERLSTALQAAKNACQRLQQQAGEGAKVADRTIRDHPYQTMGVAFGAGLLIGVLVARK